MNETALALVERYGPRGEVVLNRPEKRNAMSGPLAEALLAGLRALIADESVRVILLRGAGGFFCAGRDLDAFRQQPPPPWMATFGQTITAIHAAIYESPKPVVGALEGRAIALGSALALACDVLIAGETARFHVAEVNLGLAAPVNTLWLHVKYGPAKVLEFALAGQPTPGTELAARGLALKAVPDHRVVDEARAYCDLLAKNDPKAVAAIRARYRQLIGADDYATLVARVR